MMHTKEEEVLLMRKPQQANMQKRPGCQIEEVLSSSLDKTMSLCLTIIFRESL